MKKERLKTLLYNAIAILEAENFDSIESLITELGMTSKEYDEVMYEKI